MQKSNLLDCYMLENNEVFLMNYIDVLKLFYICILYDTHVLVAINNWNA